MVPDPTTQPCLSAEEAFAILGIERKTGYRAIKDGSFPVPVIRVGRLIRIPTAALSRLLAGEGESTPQPSRHAERYPADTAPRSRKRLTA
ncbi:MAG: helix-turn-helix domain-containing protein [Acidimicrobiia bacterium]|jgi:excisionase family DNA binding protein